MKYIFLILATFGLFYPKIGVSHMQGEALHVIGFFLISYCLNSYFVERSNLLIALFFFAISTEVAQSAFTKTRHFDHEDITYDFLGVVLFILFLNFKKINMKKLLTMFAFLGFSLFVSGQILPVELSSFTATRVKSGVSLDFVTKSEVNASHFVIEVSNDGSRFDEIATIKAKGASAYSLVVPASLSTIYFRLTQFDLDGKSEVFKTISIEAKDNKTIKLIGNALVFSESLSIYDLHGRLVKTGSNLSTDDLISGIYIAVSNNYQFLKFVKN